LNHARSVFLPPNQIEPVSSRHPHSVGEIYDGRLSGSSNALGNHRCSSTVRRIFPIGRASTLIVMLGLRTGRKIHRDRLALPRCIPSHLPFLSIHFAPCIRWLHFRCFEFWRRCNLQVNPVNDFHFRILCFESVCCCAGFCATTTILDHEIQGRYLPWRGLSPMSCKVLVSLPYPPPSPSLHPLLFPLGQIRCSEPATTTDFWALPLFRNCSSERARLV
jgi:hypothetical protein